MPFMSSYVMETMILNYYANQLIKASQYINVEIPKVLEYISTSIYSAVNDPKGIQGNINNLSWEDQRKISNRASTDRQKANEARSLESNGDHKSSIQKWQEIFGSEFPSYG